MIISITALRPKSILHSIPFWFRAIPSFNQAKNTPGNKFCEVKRIQGIQHTLTAWNDMETLRAFVSSGPHLKAVKSFRKIATGSTFHYESDSIPTGKRHDGCGKQIIRSIKIHRVRPFYSPYTARTQGPFAPSRYHFPYSLITLYTPRWPLTLIRNE